jgi:hypothetical protein
MLCTVCAHNKVCKYGEGRSSGLYCTGTKCLQYLPLSNIFDCPYEVGQTVWFIRNKKIIETTVDKLILKHGGLYIKLACNAMYETSSNSLGKTIFLTERDAEQSLTAK